VYPEYVADVKILFCPSDASTPQYLDMQSDEDGSLCGAPADPCTPYYSWHGSACLRGNDTSYMYLGWLFDQVEDTDPQIPWGDGSAPAQFVYWIGMVRSGFGSAPVAPGLAAIADQDITVPDGHGNAESTTIYRLREGIERFLIMDINNPAATAVAQSEVWIMSDAVATRASAFSHVPGGCNVLYMDGHVEFIKYPGKPPVTPGIATVVGALATDF
jgi:prepilin-type processing-associated H-X9-DG protein